MNKRKIIPSLVLNSIIFCLLIIGLIIGFTIDKFDATLFLYFTTDSNILMGITSLVYLIFLILILKNKINKIPKAVEIFKLSATVSVALTFLTVVLFLSPNIEDATMLYINSQALFHVAIPLLSIATWLIFEHSSNKLIFSECLFGLVPTGVYAIFYMVNCFTHIKNGKIDPIYDWYGFTSFGLQYVYIVVILMFGATLLISWLLWLGNKKFNIKYESMKRWQYKRFWSMFCNGLIFILFFITMIVRFVHDKADWTNLKYFTTQSNILIGIMCLVYLIFEGVQFNQKQINKHVNACKLIFTTYIAITFTVTVFALTPGAAIMQIKGWPPERLYLNANIMLHVFIPVLSMCTWLLFEHCENIKFHKLFYSFIYIAIYAIFYLAVAYTHRGWDGTIPMDYDWYKFCSFHPAITALICVGLFGATFLFAWMFRKFNYKINIYKDIQIKKSIKTKQVKRI